VGTAERQRSLGLTTSARLLATKGANHGQSELRRDGVRVRGVSFPLLARATISSQQGSLFGELLGKEAT
jgi:hypothetical protein